VTERRRGTWYAVTAYVLWGITPIFWNELRGIPAVELLAHRILWSLPLLLLVIALRRRWATLRRVFSSPRTAATAAAAGGLLAVNWGVYVWAVTSNHIVDASLGYYINPLVSVALGVVVLHERLRPAQKAAVAIAAVGVTGMAVMLQVVPWISLTLAFSFGFYGLLKKREAAAPPLEGLLGETTVLTLPAVVYLGMLAGAGTGHFGSDLSTSLLLAAAGAVTVFPLLLFGAAAQRIPLSTIGLLQYLAPTLQLLVGVWLYGESMGPANLFGFVTVWIALVLYSVDTVRAGRLAAAEAPAMS